MNHSQPMATRDFQGNPLPPEKKEVDEPDNTMRQLLMYDAVKIEGPQKKILEFAESDKLLEDKELIHFNYLCNNLTDKSLYWKTKID